jgi:hypothetical protein
MTTQQKENESIAVLNRAHAIADEQGRPLREVQKEMRATLKPGSIRPAELNRVLERETELASEAAKLSAEKAAAIGLSEQYDALLDAITKAKRERQVAEILLQRIRSNQAETQHWLDVNLLDEINPHGHVDAQLTANILQPQAIAYIEGKIPGLEKKISDALTAAKSFASEHGINHSLR